MQHTVTIRPSGHLLTLDEDETILAAAIREGFTLTYGCRNGACGTCKGKLLAGEVYYPRVRPLALTDEDRAASMLLLCCAHACSDIEVECREVSAIKGVPIRTLPARVHSLRLAAPDVMIVSLRLPQNERLRYLAGQYLDILLKDGQRRSFSMAVAPGAELLELHIRNYGGLYSQHVFGRMKERDILRFEGPFGTFFLREDSAKPVVLLASGTGFAPIKAMVEDAIARDIARPMTLYWGGRRPADLYLDALARDWSASRPGLRYIPVLSDALAQDGWSGRTGLVHRAVMEDLPDLSGHEVYACGNPLMVDAARREFVAQCGLPADAFYSDAFTPAC